MALDHERSIGEVIALIATTVSFAFSWIFGHLDELSKIASIIASLCAAAYYIHRVWKGRND